MEDAVDTILKQWNRERPDLDVSPMGVIGRISRLARRFEAEIAGTLKPFGLQPDEFDLLATLRRHGPPFELCPRDLLTTMMISSSTTTHRLDKLEARGLVERRPARGDRRMVMARLTAAGRELIDRAVEAHAAGEARLLAGMTTAQRQKLAELLRRAGAEPGSSQGLKSD